MREIRPYGSEGGVALTTPLLPLSGQHDSAMVVPARCAQSGLIPPDAWQKAGKTSRKGASWTLLTTRPQRRKARHPKMM
jgi:hypothetical protein